MKGWDSHVISECLDQGGRQDWWKLSDWSAIRAAVLGEAPSPELERTSRLDAQADPASQKIARSNWFRTPFRKNED